MAWASRLQTSVRLARGARPADEVQARKTSSSSIIVGKPARSAVPRQDQSLRRSSCGGLHVPFLVVVTLTLPGSRAVPATKAMSAPNRTLCSPPVRQSVRGSVEYSARVGCIQWERTSIWKATMVEKSQRDGGLDQSTIDLLESFEEHLREDHPDHRSSSQAQLDPKERAQRLDGL